MAAPWEDMGIVFAGKGFRDLRGFRLGEFISVAGLRSPYKSLRVLC